MTANPRRTGPVETTGRSAEVAPEPRQHERLGPYRLLQRLGEGGMGVVHLALDPQGRAVAVKVLRPHIAYDPDARSRLEREVETLARVRGSYVAAVIDSDIFGDRPYLVTRYVPGPSLDEVVREHGPLHGDELHRLGRGLVHALEAIHSVGVVHRDLKPGNVLLEDGEPVLIDFGIAHVADDVRLTSVGLVMGTPGYLSPEVVGGGAVTEATDWWGWAATVTFAASGRPPFGRGPMDVVLDRVRRGESDLSDVDPRLRPLLQAALSPDPRQRPPAGEVVAALGRYADGRPATVAVPAPLTLPVPGASPQGWPSGEDAHVDRGWLAAPRTAALPVTEPPWVGATTWPPGPAAAPAPQPGWAAQPGGAAQPPTGSPVQGGWPEPDGRSDPDDDGEAQERHTEGDPRIGRPMRTGTLIAVASVLATGAMSRPGVVVLAVVAWCWVARFSDRTLSALVVRRFERGRRRSDVPRAVVVSPWHLLVSAVGTLAGLALPALVAAAGVVCAALALGAVGTWAPAMVVGPSLGLGFLAGALVAWWGPGGASLRRGSRSVVRTMVPDGVGTQVVVGALLLSVLVLALLALRNPGQLVWWPWSGDPLGGLLPS